MPLNFPSFSDRFFAFKTAADNVLNTYTFLNQSRIEKSWETLLVYRASK